MKYRLLVSVEVIEFLEGLSQPARERLWKRFRQILNNPEQFSDYTAMDSSGRTLDVNVHEGIAIHYWEDLADRHVKILELQNADR
jgi:hypothetical protein